MLLTGEEVEICKKYSAKDEKGLVHCNECPLVLSINDLTCHATSHFDPELNRWVPDFNLKGDQDEKQKH